MNSSREGLQDFDVAGRSTAIVAIVGMSRDSGDDAVCVKVENPVVHVEGCGWGVEKGGELLYRDDGRGEVCDWGKGVFVGGRVAPGLGWGKCRL